MTGEQTIPIQFIGVWAHSDVGGGYPPDEWGRDYFKLVNDPRGDQP